MVDFAEVTTDAGGNKVANGDAIITPKPSGGPEGAGRNGVAWFFPKDGQACDIIARAADGSEGVLMRGAAVPTEVGRFVGYRVTVRTTSNMEEPTQAKVEP